MSDLCKYVVSTVHSIRRFKFFVVGTHIIETAFGFCSVGLVVTDSFLWLPELIAL